jgi:MFS family permease
MRINYKNRLGVLSFLLVLFSAAILPAVHVEAATSITIKSVNYATLQVTSDYDSNFAVNGTYKLVGEDRNDLGTNDDERLHFTLNGQAEGECTPKILIRANHDTGIPDTDQADVDVKKRDANGGTACTNINRDNITVDNINTGKLIFFNWKDKDTLEPVGKLPYNTGDSFGFASHEDHLKLRNPDYLMVRQTDGTFNDSATKPRCATYLNNFSGTESASFHVWSRGGSGGCEDDYKINVTVHFGNQQNATKAQGTATGDSGGTTGSGITNKEQCENQGGLAWLVCGLVRLMDKTINELTEQIQELLTVHDGDYNSPQLRETWGRFRNIAYLILVPMMLVMVIGTALGIGPFDAYGVRKALPRMIAAIIFISLSWPLCQFLIQISNILGSGIMGLLTSTFTNEEGFIGLGDFFGPGSGAVFTGLAAGAGVAGIAVGAVSLGIVASFALATLLGLLMGYLVLTLRLFIIVLLVIISPLAILPWIFPGNDRLWKVWRGSFVNLLLLFPLIMLLIGGGQVFASVVYSSSRNTTVEFFMIIIALVAPFYFIPAAFKFAGGVFANLAGMANDRSRGIFDRQKKYRQEKRAQGFQDFKTGSGEGRFRQSRFVTGAGRRATGGFRGTFGPDAKTIRDSRWDAVGGNAAADFTKTAEFAAQSENDPVLQGAAVGRNYNEAVKNLQSIFGYTEPKAQEIARQTQATIGFGRKQQLAAAQQLVNTGTGYTNLEQMSKTLALASGGDDATASRLAGYANYATKQKGRNDLAPGFGNLDKLVKEQIGGGPINSDTLDQATEAAWNSGSLYAIANGKPTAVKEFGRHWQAQFERGLRTGDTAQVEKAIIAMKELEAMKPNATGDNQLAINEALSGYEQAKQNYISTVGTPGGQQLAQIDKIAGGKARTYERLPIDRVQEGA